MHSQSIKDPIKRNKTNNPFLPQDFIAISGVKWFLPQSFEFLNTSRIQKAPDFQFYDEFRFVVEGRETPVKGKEKKLNFWAEIQQGRERKVQKKEKEWGEGTEEPERGRGRFKESTREKEGEGWWNNLSLRSKIPALSVGRHFAY